MIRRRPTNFMAELDRQFKAEEKRGRQEDRLRSMFERLPPDSVECDIMISGIRLDRFVGEWECEGCPLSYYDHTLGFMFAKWDDAYKVFNPVKVCIKDYLVKCKALGVKPGVVNNKHHDGNLTEEDG